MAGGTSAHTEQAANRAPSYRALFMVPGLRLLAGATVVARIGMNMQTLVLVLFVLQEFHSPPLAGLAVFVGTVPGLLVSPLAGALLDRHRRLLLIRLDYAIAATALCALAALDALGRLPAFALLGIVALASLTNPLSNSGTRSLFPVVVPRRLWARANAVDSSGYVVASIVGPAIAGVGIAALGARAALVLTAAVYVAGFLMLLAMTEPNIELSAAGSLVRDAVAGVRYVLGHRQLRALAAATSVMNIGFGVLTVGVPVLLISHLHQGPASVGAMYAVMGVAGLLASVAAGRFSSERREGAFVVAGAVLSAVAMTALLGAALAGGGLVAVALGMALFGISQGPYDVGMFSIRQRVTPPSWMGRAFAVSMSLNFIGMPVGSALGGPVVVASLPLAFAIALTVCVAAALIAAATLLGGAPAAVGVRSRVQSTTPTQQFPE